MLCFGVLMWRGCCWPCCFQPVALVNLCRLPSSPYFFLFGFRMYWWGADFFGSIVCVSGFLGYSDVYQVDWPVVGWFWPPSRRGFGLLSGWLLTISNWLLIYSLLYLLYNPFVVQWITNFQLINVSCNAAGYLFGSVICVYVAALILSLRADWFCSSYVLGFSWLSHCRFIFILQSYYLVLILYLVFIIRRGISLILGLMMLTIVIVGTDYVCCMIWVFPYFLLSPFPVFLHAQNHDTVSIGSSWYLVYSRVSGDEVKGLYLCACDELFAEADYIYVYVAVYWALALLSLARDGLFIRLFPGCSCVWVILQVSAEPPLYQEYLSNFWLDVHLMRTAAITLSAETQLVLVMYLVKVVDSNDFQSLSQALRLCNCIQQCSSRCICYYNQIEHPQIAGYGQCYCVPVWQYEMPGTGPSGPGMHRVLSHVTGYCAITMSHLSILVMYKDKLLSGPVYSTKANSNWIFLASGPEKGIILNICILRILR